MSNPYILTESQLSILHLRKKEGLSQVRIAKKLGVSPSYVCKTEKAIKSKLERARNTLNLIKSWDLVPIKIRIEPNSDLFWIPGQVYKTADQLGIHVKYGGWELISKVHETLSPEIVGRKILKGCLITLSGDGEVEVFGAKNQLRATFQQRSSK